MRYLRLANGGKLNLAKGGSLLLSGALERITTVANLQSSATDAQIQALGTAFIIGQTAELTIQSFDASLESVTIIVTEPADLNISALNAISSAQGVASVQAFTADTLASALDATLQASGIANIQAEGAQLFINAIQATASAQGVVVVASDVASALASALDAIALRDGIIPTFIPEQPIALRVVRNPLTTANLTWLDGQETFEVEIYQSNSQRDAMTKVATIDAGVQQASVTVNASDTVSFRIIPIGETGSKGKSSYIVYSAPPSNIL